MTDTLALETYRDTPDLVADLDGTYGTSSPLMGLHSALSALGSVVRKVSKIYLTSGIL